MLLILAKVSVAAIKHHDQKQVVEERIYSAYTCTFLLITKGLRIGSQARQEPRGRS